MKQALYRALKIRDGEAAKVLWMGLYLLLVVSSFIIGRIARDALFLSAFDKKYLAYMYISVAAAVPIPAYLYARVVDRYRRDRLVVVTLIGLAVLFLVMRVLLIGAWGTVVLYNFVEVAGTFLILQFWTFAGDIFSSREAKRLFAILALGSVLAGIFCGVGVSALVPIIGTENLLFIMSACLVGAAFVVRKVGAMERARLAEAVAARGASSGGKKAFQVKSQLGAVFASKHLKIVAGMTVATFVTVPLIDYQFKVLAKEAFTQGGVVDTIALTAFMGRFSTITGVIAAVMQLSLTSRIIERFGVVVALLVLPGTLMTGLIAMVAGLPSFFASVWTKGAENSFRYSIYDATMQVIYTPVPGHVRGKAKTFIDGILKPWAGGLAGAAMVLLVGPLGLPVTSLAWVALALVGAWILMVLAIGREYVKELLSTLRRRRLDFSDRALSITDDATVELLRRTLKSRVPGEVRNAIELARRVTSHDLSPDVAALLAHEDPDIRVRALEMLGGVGSIALAERVQPLFKDESRDVRAAAVRAYCAIVGEPALRVVRDELQSDAPQVRGAAVASLIKHGGLEGILLSAEHLKEMQASPDETLRLAAATVFRDIGVKNFYQPVLVLMRDPSLRVQNAAVLAAGAMQAPELIPALVYKLSQRETARAAAQALSLYGDAVAPVLGKVLGHEPEDPALRRQVPRILERIGTPLCLELLLSHLDVRDPDTRRETARSAARLRDRLGARVDEARVRAIIDEEIREHYQKLAALEDLRQIAGAGTNEHPNLLRDAIEERLARSQDRIFRLLAILYPLKTIELVRTNLKSTASTTRANAVEVLDNLLESDEKRRLLPVLEDGGRARALQESASLYKVERKAPHEWIAEFIAGRDPWLVVVALHVVAELGLSQLKDAAKEHVRHADPVVRETAARTLAVLLPSAEFVALCAPLAEDTDQSVRRYAGWLVAEARKVDGAGAAAVSSVR